MSRRLGAIVAILGGAVALAAGAYAFFTDFPRGLVVFACAFGALGAAWYGLLHFDAGGPIPVGIDGEALTLEPPLRFRSRGRALRVRIAAGHPGASPSAELPHGPLSVLEGAGRVAAMGE